MAKKQKVDVNENIRKVQEELENVKQDDIDSNAMNVLINQAIHITSKALKSSKVPAQEKRNKALSIVNKYMPSGMNHKIEVGDEFLNVIKAIHKKPTKKKRAKK